MSSTQFNVGIASETKSSSRVLKPPGGGHSDIFGPPEEKKANPRSKNNQQNSTMMGEIMGKPNAAPQAENKIINDSSPVEPNAPAPIPAEIKNNQPIPFPSESKKETCSTRGRVPPGGFSSGLW